ncbi:homoserine dehydrogenase [Kocuria coralli]|uniref:Homoserine dehydrogenase n=1 Tax=Kocuria coralli TaxID=1461025 RepID=A0A5J5L192_9MICC|nr:homoserine dehydrogenase [Kocuria coralli]KAA9395642.1 homoserine dehydrogenase [Kocuria coralli]
MTNPAAGTPAESTPTTTRIALLGAGNVGAEVARILLEERDELTERIGAVPELVGIAVRDLDSPRTVELPRELFTTDADALIDSADVVIELTGGLEPARTRILRALNAGKPVISGNKALLARHGAELHAAAEAAGTSISYEAAVAGAIPIVRPMLDSLSGDRVNRVLGIMNGTTNYILDQMDTTGASFDDALAEAQRLGFAEADPTADVEGHDAASKVAILGGIAFHSSYTIDDVYCRGITGVTAEDVEAAREAGYVIKLLGVAERVADDGDPGQPSGVNLRVVPTMLPRKHPLAGVHGAFNAVFVEAENAGELMFYGPGAGGAPTASAVMGDLVAALRRSVAGGPGVGPSFHADLPATSVDGVRTSFSLTLLCPDRTGVLSAISTVFAEHGVSISTMQQRDLPADDQYPGQRLAELRIVTHQARNADLVNTVEAIRGLDVVLDLRGLIRVENPS